jgi:hypothetical protein
MVIVAQDDSTYARLSFHVGPGSPVLVPVGIDYSQAFGPSDHDNWDAEYAANVRAVDWLNPPKSSKETSADAQERDSALSCDFLAEFESMDSVQRQLFLDELAERPELWDEESEVMLL